MRLAAVLVLAFALAGCSSSPDADPAQPSGSLSQTPTPSTPSAAAAPSAPSPAPSPTAFNQSFELSLTEAYTATRFVSSGNCATLGGGAHVLSGTARATWAAATPSAQRLALLSGPAAAPVPREPQASPASWDVGHLIPDGNGTLAFAVVLPGPGAAYQQPVTLTLDLLASGPLEADPTLRACVG